MIVEVCWSRSPCIAGDFMADVITQRNNANPTVRDDDLQLVGGYTTFVVLRTRKVERGFDGGTPKHKSGAFVYNLVLMDGSNTVFAARLNSGLTARMAEITQHNAGSTITVKKKHFVWMEEVHHLNPRGIMTIDNFDWHDAPSQLEPAVAQDGRDRLACWEDNLVSDKQIFRTSIDYGVVDIVKERNHVAMLNYSLFKENGWLWMFMSKDGLKNGY
jgi:hypothetical protein